MGIYYDELAPGQSGSALAWRLLRRAVMAEYGVAAPAASKGPNGKPYFPDMPQVHFSLSHTKTHVMCALSSRPVGADIETVRRVLPGVERRIAAPEELRQFGFFELWVLKEACVKLYGHTLADMRRFVCSLAGGAVRVETPDGRAVRARLLDEAPGCRAAVAEYGEE